MYICLSLDETYRINLVPCCSISFVVRASMYRHTRCPSFRWYSFTVAYRFLGCYFGRIGIPLWTSRNWLAVVGRRIVTVSRLRVNLILSRWWEYDRIWIDGVKPCFYVCSHARPEDTFDATVSVKSWLTTLSLVSTCATDRAGIHSTLFFVETVSNEVKPRFRVCNALGGIHSSRFFRAIFPNDVKPRSHTSNTFRRIRLKSLCNETFADDIKPRSYTSNTLRRIRLKSLCNETLADDVKPRFYVYNTL